MKDLFSSASVVGTRSWRHVRITALKLNTGAPLNFGLARPNIERKKLIVSETRTVGVLRFASTSSRYTLVPEGTRLTGGWQDRVVNAAVLIPPNSTVDIQVSCVEYNRWHKRAGGDGHTFQIAPELAGHAQRTVLKETTGTGHRADQHTVWESVDDAVTTLGAGNGAGTLTQAFEAKAGDRSEALAALGYVEGANGIAVSVAGRIRMVEAYNSARKMEVAWAAVVGSLLIDVAAPAAQTVAEADIHTTVATLTDAPWQSVPAAAAGQESRTSTGAARGTVLSVGESVVYASAFFN